MADYRARKTSGREGIQSTQPKDKCDSEQPIAPPPQVDIDVVFPQTKFITYERICDNFRIDIPDNAKFHVWMRKVLTVLLHIDLNADVSSYEWMVLLHPSLQLISSDKQTDSSLKNTVDDLLCRFRTHIKSLAKSQVFSGSKTAECISFVI